MSCSTKNGEHINARISSLRIGNLEKSDMKRGEKLIKVMLNAVKKKS